MITIKKSKKDISIGIGMSGGIDSSLSAFLLKKQGYNVTGITLKLWDEGSRCCDLQEIDHARRFSHEIGIPHYVIDLREEFKESIVDYFIQEYLNGRTPNPCVVCNKEIKFAELIRKCSLLNLDYIATGHYSRIIKKKDAYFLSKAKDLKKTQEYFLARVKKENLKRIIFPLAELTKDEVKKMAMEINYPFQTKESQEICFIQHGLKYFDFILKNIKTKMDLSANIIDKQHRILGQSSCYFKYTIGQRGGLGLSDKTPYYVLKINAEPRTILVGKKIDAFTKEFTVKEVYWYSRRPVQKIKVKIRYNQEESPAIIQNKNKKTLIRYLNAQYAISPGQLAVFYKDDTVIGSGWIDEVL